jgi:hypothetical protein
MCRDDAVYIPGERTSIYHLLRAQRRQQTQAIKEIKEIMDVLPTTQKGIFE